MAGKASSAVNATVQAVILKKCDRTYHKPETNKKCANGACQHTCEPARIETCSHKWTVRYSVNSRQREQSFTGLEGAQTFQLELSSNKKTQGDMFTDPRAGHVPFLPLCGKFVDGLEKANAASKDTYKSNIANPAVTEVLTGKSVLEVAKMRDEVKKLLNKTLAAYSDDYRGNIKRIIIGTLDECVNQGIIPRHTLTGIELGARVVTAEQFERENRGLVTVADDVVTKLADGITDTVTDKLGRTRKRVIPGLGIAPWLQRTMGLRIREALGVRKSDFKQRADGTRYLHLCWQASENGRKLEPLKHRQAGQFRDIPVPDMVWNMVQAMPDSPLVPGPGKTPYMPYSTARNRFGRMLAHLGIEGAHTHSLRHQFATEALDNDPRELPNISQVLGHDSVETTMRFYIHPSANAEQRIGAMMNARWTARPAPQTIAGSGSKRAMRTAARPIAAVPAAA